MQDTRLQRLLVVASLVLAPTRASQAEHLAVTRPAGDDPVATAVAFDEAMRRGDLQTIQSLSVTRDEHAELLKALASWGATYTHLEGVALKAFGEQGAAKITRNDVSLKLLRRGRASVDGHTAVVADVDGRQRYWLARRDGAWKVRTEQLPPMRDSELSRSISTFVHAAGANSQVARDIESGKLRSAAEASAALKERTWVPPTTAPVKP